MGGRPKARKVTLADLHSMDQSREQEVPNAIILDHLKNAYNKLCECFSPNYKKAPLMERDKEKKDVLSFITENVEGKAGSNALYISGLPGAGKTSIVEWACSEVQRTHKEGFCYCYINGMLLRNPHEVWVRIAQELRSNLRKRARDESPIITSDTALETIRTHVEKNRIDRPFVLVIDEMDRVMGNVSTDLLFDLLDMTHKNAKFIFVGIANRQDIWESFTSKDEHVGRLTSRIDRFQRLVFEAYKTTQLVSIIESRTTSEVTTQVGGVKLTSVGTELFQPKAFEMLSKLVGKYSGSDCRKALDSMCQVVEKKCFAMTKSFESGSMRLQNTSLHLILDTYKITTEEVRQTVIPILNTKSYNFVDVEKLALAAFAVQMARQETFNNEGVRIVAIAQRYDMLQQELERITKEVDGGPSRGLATMWCPMSLGMPLHVDSYPSPLPQKRDSMAAQQECRLVLKSLVSHKVLRYSDALHVDFGEADLSDVPSILRLLERSPFAELQQIRDLNADDRYRCSI